MIELFAFAVIVAILYLGSRMRAMNHRIESLELENESLSEQLKRIASKLTFEKEIIESPVRAPVTPPITPPVAPPVVRPVTPPVVPFVTPPAAPTREPEPVLAHKIKKIPEPTLPETEVDNKFRQLWSEWEKKFAENWTGILGSVVMVLGVTFLGIYAALQMEPRNRFILILAFAFVLWGLRTGLRRNQKFILFSDWLGSSGAAIFLFACTGAGHIPGLYWIENETAALALVSVGLLVNLYFGYLGRNQIFMSLHTVLCLTSLIIIPQDSTLVIGAIASLGGIILTYRHQWDKHLIVTASSFWIFELRWYFHAEPLDDVSRFIGIGTTVVVAGAVAAMHYRKVYSSAVAVTLPLITHIMNWLFASTILVLLSTGSKYVFFPLALASLGLYIIARHARKSGIPWLYRCDTVVSQFIGAIAIFVLGRWEVDSYTLMALLFFQTFLFTFLMFAESERTLARFATVANFLCGFLMILIGIGRSVAFNRVLPGDTLITSICTVFVGLAVHWLLLKKYGETFGSLRQFFPLKSEISFLGIVVGGMLAVVGLCLREHEWFGYANFGMIVGLIAACSVLQSNGLRIGAIVSIVFGHLALFAQLATVDTTGYFHCLIGIGLMFTATCIYFGVHLRREVQFSSAFVAHLVLVSALAVTGTFLHSVAAENVSEAIRLTAVASGFGGIAFAFYVLVLTKKRIYLNSIIQPVSFSGRTLELIYGIILGCVPLTLAFSLQAQWYSEVVTTILLTALIIARARFQWDGLGIGILFSITVAQFLSWSAVFYDPAMEIPTKLFRLTPLFLASALAIRYSKVESLAQYLRSPGIYLLGFNSAVAVYLLTNPISSILPGVLWLLLSVAALQIAQSVPDPPENTGGRPARFLLHIGYALILLFLVRHVFFHLQVEDFVVGVKLRLVVALFAIAVFALWAITGKKAGAQEYMSWTILHPLLVELLIVFGAATIALEVENLFLPLVWIVIAILLFLATRNRTDTLSRLRFYSLLFGWTSALQLAVVTSTLQTPSPDLFMQPTTVGVVNLILSVVFLTQLGKNPFLDEISFPSALNFLSRFVDLINRNRIAWTYYPFFISTALFLFWRFDSAILTLLLVGECFVIFGLSIVLRIIHFKTLSMFALGGCLIRLVVFDLAQSGTFTRGVVFLGVGGIMMLMNYLYKRHKSALEV